jgi:MHS family alpha-ketoglutarate permease-like MFS transporter
MQEITAIAREEEAKDTHYRLKSIFGGSIGNLVEWYDWYSYSAFALYFSPIFFPNSSPNAQLLDTAGIFAVGFLMRPIGGVHLYTHDCRTELL